MTDGQTGIIQFAYNKPANCTCISTSHYPSFQYLNERLHCFACLYY